ncbi:Superfamily II DNA and RNA helicase [Granulicatella balaenopterae]|uniref:Superfamily II DNA and RNA helicase n=1 Tax=Granulicatella balaenopterae TaxID=137733 RepID=A0A1H9GYD8_9LACT|nr:DEAD/DEAH box helicase [Granulicatella balaenopterae]SEQ55142.1 Superfamily II DNA and RNA helicase [Granulicatella balaenopterae]
MRIETEALQQLWDSNNFEKETLIQEKTMDIIKDGKDVIGISPTGTGKTVAYLLPLIDKMEANKQLQTVVLAPSQELARQIGEVARVWCKAKGLTVQVITGGVNQKRQLEQLKKKPEMVIGTVGRLVELSKVRKLKLHQVTALVLDEADYLLKPDQIGMTRDFVKKCPSQRQMVFFSATSNETLLEAEKWFNVKPEMIDVRQEKEAVNANVTHGYIITPTRKRDEQLRRLAQLEGMQALVFVRSIADVAILAEKMIYRHIPVAVLSSDTNKLDRQKAMKQLRSGEVRYLIATEVAARGLDVEDLPAVIHYDVSETTESYTHKSGRTGRMGKNGLVLSLVNERELRNLKHIVPETVTLEELFVYGGELVTSLPEKQRNENRDKKKSYSKDKKKSYSREGKEKKTHRAAKRDERKSYGNRDDNRSSYKRNDRKSYGNRDDNRSSNRRNSSQSTFKGKFSAKKNDYKLKK